ncbi:MAG: hypothetical protein IJ840_02470 [Bacteroidales bacterium]|nr:hypothetical protein [Bacteroidales bacterium]
MLLPLRLKWEPLYSYTDEAVHSPLAAGDRVRVEFGGKEYVGVVTVTDAADGAARIGLGKIKPILGVADGLERISDEETRFWRLIADYYLCDPGEVYKAAYPAGKFEE